MAVAGDLKRVPGAGVRDPLTRPVLVASGEQPRRPAAVAVPSKEAPALATEVPQAASLQMSFDLLDRANKGLSFFSQRHKLLEEHIKQLEAWSNARIQTAEEAADHWKAAAAATEKKLEDLQRSIQAATQRAETAEATMERDRTALASLQDRILAVFGADSEAHEAMADLDVA